MIIIISKTVKNHFTKSSLLIFIYSFILKIKKLAERHAKGTIKKNTLEALLRDITEINIKEANKIKEESNFIPFLK